MLEAWKLLRQHLENNPELKAIIGEWVQDFLMDQLEFSSNKIVYWLRMMMGMPLVNYINMRIQVQQSLDAHKKTAH